MKCENCEGKGFIEYEHGEIQVKCQVCEGTGVIDDSISGTEPDNKPVGSADTGKPKRTEKSKAKKKARARTL